MTLIFILVFSLALSNSFFLHCLSSSVFWFLLFDVGNGGAFFGSVVVVCSLPLFTAGELECIWPGKSRYCACAGGGALPREEGCQQHMHDNDWHFSDTPLGCDWLCLSGTGRFLQIKLGPLGGATDSGFLHSQLYLILLSDHNNNFSKYNQKKVTDYSFKSLNFSFKCFSILSLYETSLSALLRWMNLSCWHFWSDFYLRYFNVVQYQCLVSVCLIDLYSKEFHEGFRRWK